MTRRGFLRRITGGLAAVVLAPLGAIGKPPAWRPAWTGGPAVFVRLGGAGPAYEWRHVVPVAGGGWRDLPSRGGRSVPAREVNGRRGLNGKIVRVWPDRDRTLAFSWGEAA